MKRLLLALSLSVINMASAQTLIIGAGSQSGTSSNGATGDPGPMYRSSATSSFVYSRHHYLYTQTELAGLPNGAIITELAWYKDNNAATNSNMTFEIYMKNSALSAVQTPPQTWAALTTGSTQAYSSSSASVSSAIGWVPFSLTTPVVYSGDGLEISVNFDISNGSSPWTTAGFSWQKDPITNRTISYCGSSANTTLSNARTVRPRLRITYIPGSPCTSPPTPGTVTLSPNTSVCPGEPVNLNLTGNSFGSGQTYQWQSSATLAGPFANVGASSIVAATTVNPTTTTYYRAAVTCGSSTAYTPAVQVIVNSNMAGGTYTIDNTLPTAGTNFNSFSDAINAMSCGITGPVVFDVASGSYNEQAVIPAIPGASATNRITFRSAAQDPNAVNVNFTATSASDNYVFKLDDASYITFKDLTFIANGTSFSRVIEYAGAPSYDSILNCKLVGPVLTSASTNTALFFADDMLGKNNVFIGNTFSNGSYGLYYRGSGTGSQADGVIFDGNTFENQFTYGAYPYYTKNLKFNNNTVVTNSTDNLFYGVYIGYSDGPLEVTRNRVEGALGGYGMYIYYCDASSANRGTVANNTISMGAGTNTVYALRIYNCSYQNVYNNSVNVISGSATASWAGYIYSSSSTYNNNTIRNNAFANNGQGYALYVYNPTYNTSDYNNLYTAGPQLVERGTPNANFATLSDWRIASSQELNSIAYDPGYMSATNLHPDPANPASWSLNGRGVHIAGNSLDFDNNPRITALADGAPDIGAYEFTPTSVPPIAEATPAMPAPGTQQVFTFGQDTVAVIDWKPNSVMPNFLEVRQYSGTKAPQYPAPGFMYFYTDINTQSVTHNFDAAIYYKDTWMGTIAAESNLRMVKKLGSNPWQAFNGAESSAEINRNFLHASWLSSMGFFTGGNDGDIFSATVKPAATTVFCPGGSVILNANTGMGYSYQWYFNNTPIQGATGPTITATMAGDYTVAVTNNANNITVTSDRISVTIIPAPAAQVSASGALTYCTGSSLTLSTPQAPGLSYQWQFNGSNIPGATSASQPVTGAGLYTVMVNNIACGTLSPVVTVEAGPLTFDLGQDIVMCEEQGKTITLDAGHPGADYTWSTGDTSQQLSINTSGKYWVEVNAGPNCVASDTLQVTITPLPSVNGISYLRSGNTYDFSANGMQNVVSYLWLFSDGTSSADAAPTHVFNIPPSYVKLVVFNECGTDTVELNLPVNVESLNGDGIALNLYPNPASDKITVQASGKLAIHELVVMNQLGQVVLKEGLSGSAKIRVIDVSNLPSGSYILRAGTSEGIVSRPFNITR